MSSQKVTGLASGFDTQSIVESLMKLEKKPYEKLDIKKQTEQLKLKAYQAVNSYFLKFRTSIGNLSSAKLWNANAVVSTNEKSITATANEYAVKGSYSFRVAQLATAAQYMSTGFKSAKTPFVAQNEKEPPTKLGTITLASAKTRVDTSAKVDVLNGGKGIFRGSIRITDSGNATSVIDLSACDTMDDVVRTINESPNAQITASIREGKLYIKDEANGNGELKIQNVGTGTTATDLGIAGSAKKPTDPNAAHALVGRNVYIMGDDTPLDMLNDGLGIEEGKFALRVSGPASYIDILVDVNNCTTVGDVVGRVNDQIAKLVKDGHIDEKGGGKAAELLDGLRFGVSKDKNSFSFTGTKKGQSYLFFDGDDGTLFKSTPGQQLGLSDLRRTAMDDGEEIIFGRVLGDVNSPLLKNLSGVTSNRIGESTVIPTAFSKNTLLSELNGGKGLDISRPMQIQLWEGMKGVAAGSKPRIIEDLFDPTELQKFLDGRVDKNGVALSDTAPSLAPTVEDLTFYLNNKLAKYAADPTKNAAGLTGMQFKIDEYNNRLVIAGAQSGYSVEIGGTMAAQLGLSRAIGNKQFPGLELTKDDSDYQTVTDKLKEFYTGDTKSLMPENKSFNLDPKKGAVTALSALAKLHGIALPEGDLTTAKKAEITAALDSMLGTPLTMTFNDGSGEKTVSVDLSSLVGTITADTEVPAFLEAVNGKIQDAFTAAYPGMSAPKLAVHSLGDRFQWSNMDFSKSWKMNGGILSNLGLEKTIDTLPAQPVSAVKFDMNPGATGYLKPIDYDPATTKLKDLNFALGLSLGGEKDDVVTIDLGKDKKISITMEELREAVYGTPGSPKAGQDMLVEDYLTALNGLVSTKLGALTGLKNTPEMKFAVKDGKMTVTGLKHADQLVISGTGASIAKTGIGETKVTTLKDGESYDVAALNPSEITKQKIEGLGEIKLKIGDAEVVLSTKGLDKSSTLSELLERLNRELAEAPAKAKKAIEDDTSLSAADKTAALEALAKSGIDDLKDVRFTLNSSGTGIAVENNSSRRVVFQDTKDAQTLAKDLGLVGAEGEEVRVESYSFKNAGSLGRNYLSRATSLSQFLGGNTIPGGIQLLNAKGQSVTLGLENCKTVGDVLDAINGYADAGFGLYAQINERGDGITIIEAYPEGKTPKPSEIVSNIGIRDLDGGNIAKKLGIAGIGSRDKPEYKGNSVLEGSLTTNIDVMSSDTLESIMYRLTESGNYKCAIINDGTGGKPYRLTISSAVTGENADFVIDSDVDMLGFNQTSRGRDAKVLYGDPNSSSSPVMLSSSTNSNSNAILGLTLNFKQVSKDWTTLTIDTDKGKVTDEIKGMVEAYNELAAIITQLDAYDEETGEPGILFGDTSIRSLMDSVNDAFYTIYNPNNKRVGSVDENGKQNTWTWMDLGVGLTAKNSNPDGSGSWYSTMDLDMDKLDNMVAKNWEVLATMLSNQRNVSNSNLDESVRPSGSFNGALADGFEAKNAINGDTNKSNWGAANGIMAKDTIKSGSNEYTIWFPKPTTITRLSIFHYSNDTALKDFTVEYMDVNTGKWETLRNVQNNASDANHLGLALPTTASAIRIKADSTNAKDDKFRLLDVQVYEEAGLAGKLNQLATTLGDIHNGFLAERNTEVTNTIKDIDEQMARLQSRLDAREQSLWRRFTSMEKALGEMQNQASYFTNMMNSMSNSKKK